MQKILRRAYLADKQATKRIARKKEKAQRDFLALRRQNTVYYNRMGKADIVAERKARREDYELGPLAPRRDVGSKKETYGTMLPQRLRGAELTEEEKKKVLAPFGGKLLSIVAGDRVVLLDGKDKGKIGKVQEVDASRAEVVVENLNMVDVAIPQWMREKEQSDVPIRSLPKAVPITSVRLVHALHDAETGTTRDVIVKEIINTSIWQSRDNGRITWKRMIPGLNEVIPWPKTAPTEYEIYEGDTVRVDVETRSYEPKLLTPPFPSTVIDELRNKFSKFRTRHTEEYIAQKEAEAAEEKAKAKALAMEMPVQTANKLARKVAKKKAAANKTGKNKARKLMLISLGQHVVRRRQQLRNEARATAETA